VFTNTHRTQSWASRIQFVPSIRISLSSILMLSSNLRLGLPSHASTQIQTVKIRNFPPQRAITLDKLVTELIWSVGVWSFLSSSWKHWSSLQFHNTGSYCATCRLKPAGVRGPVLSLQNVQTSQTAITVMHNGIRVTIQCMEWWEIQFYGIFPMPICTLTHERICSGTLQANPP